MSITHLGNNIARLRGFRRLTQKQVASKLKMRQQDYSKLEAKPEIDDDLLKSIAEAIDFPVELIRQLDNSSVISYNQQGGNTGSIFYQIDPADKLVEVYERLIKEKDEMLKQKDEVIAMYKNQQKAS